jgi:hypothetical protein
MKKDEEIILFILFIPVNLKLNENRNLERKFNRNTA